MRTKYILSSFLVLATFMGAQDRFTSGDLRGFTKSPSEGIINHLDQPFVVRSFRGLVLRSVGDKSPLPGTLLEIRGPGDSTTIKACKADSKGQFHLKQIQPGKYVFKATALGFQSIVGTVVISPAAQSHEIITLRMDPGA